MTNFDDLKLSVEALSGGKNTVLFDDLGMPSIMVPIPKFKLSDVIDGAPQETHPAFIIDGEEKDVIYISKYQNIVMNDRAYSLPYKDPKVYTTFDQAVTYCRNKGPGWHLMTNAEWAALALWCKKNGFMPRGNNSYGKDHSATHEKGVPTYIYDTDTIARVATGSGPASWAHDGTNEGIFDLNGNVWEWVAGFRLADGEIQVIPYNEAAKDDASMASDSTLWKAILQDGSLVAPGTADTLKIDGETATPSGIRINTSVVNQTTDENYLSKTLETITAADGVTIPMLLKALGIAPVDANHGGDNVWARNKGERLPFRGGYWIGGSDAGVFSLHLSYPRSGSSSNIGFRAAYIG
jgi:hypothetical protein